MNNPKIGIVAHSGIFPFKYGGPQEVIFHLINNLSNDFNFVIFLRLYSHNNFSLKNISVFFKENIEIIPCFVEHGKEYKLLSLYINLLKNSRKLDLIFYNAPPYFLDTIPLKLYLKKKIIFDFHGGLFAENLFEDNVILKYSAKLIKNSFRICTPYFDRVIVHSQYMKNIAINHWIDKNKIVVIPLGINIEEFKNAKKVDLCDDPKLLFVGRLEKIKGCHILLHAISRIVEYYPRLKLYIVGKGPMENYLTQLTKKLKIDKNVIFLGYVDRKTLLSLYKSVDICIFPSTYNEGFGVVVLEAMASGAPTIASMTGGMKERIIPYYDGILVKRGDVRDLADKIRLLLDDDSLRRKLSKNAKKTAAKYDWKIISKMYKRVFIEVINL